MASAAWRSRAVHPLQHLQGDRRSWGPLGSRDPFPGTVLVASRRSVHTPPLPLRAGGPVGASIRLGEAPTGRLGGLSTDLQTPLLCLSGPSRAWLPSALEQQPPAPGGARASCREQPASCCHGSDGGTGRCSQGTQGPRRAPELGCWWSGCGSRARCSAENILETDFRLKSPSRPGAPPLPAPPPGPARRVWFGKHTGA